MSGKFQIVSLLALLLTVISCEHNFDPIAENNEYGYSMYGVLDTSSDTQWVRVMPLRESVLRDSIHNQATVTIIKESTGERIVMEDSLFELRKNSFFWFFFTTTEILPEHTYTIEAVSPEGEITSATTTIPPDFPTPEIEDNGNTCTVSFYPDFEHLVVAETDYKFKIFDPIDSTISDFQFYKISYLERVIEFHDRDEFTFNPYADLAKQYEISSGSILELSGVVTIASADTFWYSTDNDEKTLPDVRSNVEYGLGVLIGTVSQKHPLRPNIESQSHLIVCPTRE